MNVKFSYADRKLNLSGKNQIKDAVAHIFKREKVALHSINYIFCSDDYLLDINRQFLQHDYYTDIITFDFTEDDEQGTRGEVYVSVDRVKDNAITEGTGFESEMLRVVFHGALHLCGYGDKTKSEIQAMRNKEDEYLRLYKAQ